MMTTVATVITRLSQNADSEAFFCLTDQESEDVLVVLEQIQDCIALK